MRITATSTIPGRVDLSAHERLHEENPVERLPFHATISTGESIVVDDKYYTLEAIQNALGREWITITEFDQQTTFEEEITTDESSTPNFSLTKVEIWNRADYPQDAFEKYNANMDIIDSNLGGGGGTWGSITGNVSSQTDLYEVFLTQSNASSIYLSNSIAVSTYLTISNAASTYLIVETDPIFIASNAYSITAQDLTDIQNLSGVNTGDQNLNTKANVSGQVFTGNVSATNLSGLNTGDQDLSSYITSANVSSTYETIANVSTHTSDATIHFTEGSIDHTAISNIGSNTHAQIDTALIRLVNTSGTNTGDQDLQWGSITGNVSDQTDLQSELNTKANVSGQVFSGAISSTNLSGTNTGDQNLNTKANVSGQVFSGAISATNLSGTNTGDQDLSSYITSANVSSTYETIANVSTHTSDATIHFTEGSIDHTAISNIGSNTHAQIDTALIRLANTSGTNTGDQNLQNVVDAANTTSTAIVFQDNVKAYFGTSDDASITYDGTDLVIDPREVGSGNVKISTAYTLPDSDGTINQVLTTNGAGVVTFANVPSVSFGTDNQIPYTNASADDFDYSAVFTFDGTDAKIQADSSKLYFGTGNDYSIEWNGSDAVHTITAGDFAFMGGSVGIGTTAPAGMFEITATGPTQIFSTFTDTASIVQWLFRENTTTLATLVVLGSTFSTVNRRGLFEISSTDTGGTGVAFRTNGAERARVDNSGNWGFGTTTPSERLDVIGDVEVSADIHNLADNGKHFFGAGDDFSIEWDGTAPLVTGIGTATVATGDKVWVQDADDSDRLKTVTAQSIADLAGTVSFGTDNQIPYTNAGGTDFDYGELTYATPILGISAVDPEFRLTDTGNSEYSRVTKSDTLNQAIRHNRVDRPASAGSITVVANTGSPTETTDGLYTILTFNSSGDVDITGSANIEVLVVGGGAGGGSLGGGGGAGGFNYDSAFAVSTGNYIVTVGAGGAGGSSSNGTSGGSSAFNTVTTTGGGGGGKNENNGVAGASGGGGGVSGVSKTGGAGSTGGNGGNNFPISGSSTSGGGGGATGNGSNGSSSKGGNGGAGTANSITGSSVTYGGGGGGSGNDSGDTGGIGGSGGGGNGGYSAGAGTAGTDGLGGGGGGNWGSGYSGGDGVVIIRFLSAGITTVESNVWSSSDGANPDEEGVSTFGYAGIAGRGSRTILDGQTIRFNINGTEHYQIDNSGDLIAPDNQKIYFGTAKDSSVTYDGTDLVIDPREVGSGNVKISNADLDLGANNLINLSNVSATVSDQDLLFNINDGGTTRTAIQIHGDEGSVSMPRQSYVFAGDASKVISTATLTTLTYASEFLDNLSEFNNATGKFTALTAGVYFVNAHINIINSNTNALYELRIYVNGSTKATETINVPGASFRLTMNISGLFELAATGYIEIKVFFAAGETLIGLATENVVTIMKVA